MLFVSEADLTLALSELQKRGWMGGAVLKREGMHVSLWLICTVIWQKPTQHHKAIFLQLKKKCSRKTERIMLSAQNVKLYSHNVKILRLSNLFMYYCSCLIVAV